MAQNNIVICYEGIQVIYRNAMVNFIRTRLISAYPEDYSKKLKNPFQKEWTKIENDAQTVRLSSELSTKLKDEFDLLSVNHFFNLFDVYYDIFGGDDLTTDEKERQKQKQTLLYWLRLIKNLRDPLSHPSEENLLGRMLLAYLTAHEECFCDWGS